MWAWNVVTKCMKSSRPIRGSRVQGPLEGQGFKAPWRVKGSRPNGGSINLGFITWLLSQLDLQCGILLYSICLCFLLFTCIIWEETDIVQHPRKGHLWLNCWHVLNIYPFIKDFIHQAKILLLQRDLFILGTWSGHSEWFSLLYSHHKHTFLCNCFVLDVIVQAKVYIESLQKQFIPKILNKEKDGIALNVKETMVRFITKLYPLTWSIVYPHVGVCHQEQLLCLILQYLCS